MELTLKFDSLMTAGVLLVAWLYMFYLEHKLKECQRALILKYTGVDIERGEEPQPPSVEQKSDL